VVAGIGVLAVLAVFAPDPAPAPSPLLQVAEREPAGEDFLIMGDLLFIGSFSAVDGAPPTWSVHQLPVGDYRWSVPEVPLAAAPEGPVVTVAAFTDTSTARDPATGTALWSAHGLVTPMPGADVAVVTGDPWFTDEGPFRVRYRNLAVVDLATGAPRWSARSDHGWQVVGGPSAVVTVDLEGVVEVRDLATGAVRATAVVPEASVGAVNQVVAGDAFVVVHGSEDSFTLLVRAHSLSSLTVRWEAEVALFRDGDFLDLSMGQASVQWSGQAGSGLLDLRTGEVFTVAGSRPSARVLGDVIVWAEGSEWPREVVHRATGQVLADLAGWRLVEPGQDPPDHLLLTRVSAGGTTLGRFDPATAHLSYLGRVPQLLSGCQAFDGGLVCTVDRRLSLWRWR
jgi:hypothetical protein